MQAPLDFQKQWSHILRLINFETRINLTIYLIYFMDKTLGEGILLVTNK